MSSSQPTAVPSRARRWIELLLLLAALGVRAAMVIEWPGALVEDPDGYRALARNVVEHGTLGRGDVASAYRPPLYPLTLVPCVLVEEYARPAIAVLHVLLGTATVWIVFRLGWACGLGYWAVLAGLLVACDPILLGQSTQVMTETPAALLTALALWLLVRTVQSPTAGRAAALGAVLGLAGLTRPELLLWALAAAPMLLIVLEPWAVRAKVLGAATAAMLVVIAPWAARNQAHFGRPLVTTTHGGYTMLLANNPSFYEHLRTAGWGSVWDAQQLGPAWGGKAHHAGPADEWAADRRAYNAAWNAIAQQPRTFAWACLVRTGRLWAVSPHRGDERLRWAVAGWYVVEYILVLLGIWAICRSRRDPGGLWLWGILLVVCMTGVHAVYWSDMRMRAPLTPVLALAAVAAPAWLRPNRLASKRNEKRDLDEFIDL
ncbi:MAG: glycosyltransferase family 39 protein [Pirellulales bacterium]|nr:glycosyltransferase family 39 protein [Pirellulales bacterium]